LSFEEWLELGFNNGWVGPQVCITHDGLPMTEEEEQEMDEGDPCIHVVRLYEDKDTKRAVEENHSPSLWRASNLGYTVFTEEE